MSSRTHKDIRFDLEEAEGELAGLEDRQCELEDEIWELKKELKKAEKATTGRGLTPDELERAHRKEVERYELVSGKKYKAPAPKEMTVARCVSGKTMAGNRWIDKIIDKPKKVKCIGETP